MSRYYRNGRDLGYDGTIKWLEKWYDEPLDLDVQEISITCPSVIDRDHYQAAKKGKQSDTHAFLKYTAHCWLEDKGLGDVSYERRLYIPYDEAQDHVEKYILQDGKVERVLIDTSTPRVLAKADCNWDPRYGSFIEVDVICEGKLHVSVEVGATRPYNLLTPLLDGIVQQAVWIPFPDTQVDPPSVVRAYSIT